jgi:SPP1 gp7 family putative phage head morphogenesis protein
MALSKVKRRQLAQTQASLIGSIRRPKHPFRLRQRHQTHRTPSQWDTVYGKAVQEVQRNGGWDITGISGPELMQIQDTLARGLERRWSESSFARAIKPIIGLGPRFDQAVQTYRNRLLAEGRPLGEVQRLVQRYHDSLLRYRANLVAEYELRTALGQAQRDYWRDRQAQGLLGANAVRIFRCHKDERTCPMCRGLDGHRSPVADDTNAPPLHPNCRCWEVCADQGLVRKLWLPDEEICKAFDPNEPRNKIGEWTGGIDDWVIERYKKETGSYGQKYIGVKTVKQILTYYRQGHHDQKMWVRPDGSMVKVFEHGDLKLPHGPVGQLDTLFGRRAHIYATTGAVRLAYFEDFSGHVSKPHPTLFVEAAQPVNDAQRKTITELAAGIKNTEIVEEVAKISAAQVAERKRWQEAGTAARRRKKLPEVPWVDPPPPTGVRGQRKGGGMTAIGLTNTELGDRVEDALVEHMGMVNEHPTVRQGPLDLSIGEHGYEVKAVTEEAAEYKAKPKASEVAAKLAYAKAHHLVPHTMVVVYSQHEGKLYVYSHPGIGAYRLTDPAHGWVHHGTIPFDLGQDARLVVRKWIEHQLGVGVGHTGRMPLAIDFRSQELSKKVLTTGERKKIPRRLFAIPEKAPGSGSYPIPDIAHARNALSRVAQHGTSEEQARVRAACYRHYPELKGGGNGYTDTTKMDRLGGFRHAELVYKVGSVKNRRKNPGETDEDDLFEWPASVTGGAGNPVPSEDIKPGGNKRGAENKRRAGRR